jgi:tRNA 2-(methylsulfanyl)-N6-isopentenyladenosine37 hydroxylase
VLGLKSETDVAWVRRVEDQLEAVLIDHAHCEKKAAGTALNMIFSYVEHVDVVTKLIEVVREELDHFRQVLAIIGNRGITFRGQPQSEYGKRLGENIRRDEPAKAVDRCVVAALIEARSCERFLLLRDHLRDRELAALYGALLESEGRHHGLYLGLAARFAPEAAVRARFEELAAVEASILAEPGPFPRLHA